jgi:D-inositol-3-phosphate glycosyltransferase
MVSEHASPLAQPGGVDAGGQNVHVGALAAELGRRGVRVVVYTRRDSPTVAQRVLFRPGAEVEHVDAGPPVPLAKDDLTPFLGQFADNLRCAWAQQPPQVVHAHFWMSGVVALRAAKQLHIPVVQTFHALGAQKQRYLGTADPSPPGRLSAERTVAAEVDAVAATTAEEVEELARCGAYPRHVRVIPCGVDTRAFAPHGPCERPRRPRLLVLGRLVERKGVDDVLRALPLLPEAELLIAGGSGAAKDRDMCRLTALAHDMGVSDRVDWVGPVAHRRVPALLRSCDVVICVPWYEPFGIVAVEAMACGVPVVASAVGGLRETVVDGETGLHVPPRDPQRLAAAIRTVLGDAALRARFAAAGVRHAEARYTWCRVADDLLALYAYVIDGQTR